MAEAAFVCFLEAGQELEACAGRRYRLVARLGGGKYSEVWRAEVVGQPGCEVAAKIMADGLDEQERSVFFREVETVLSLAKEGERLGLWTKDAPLVPVIVGPIAEAHCPPFFVETLASGKPVDLILRDDGYLPEPDALMLGEQLCRVFQALHDGLRRSYLDFQPKNVFWDAENRRITVVDWNLLSPEGKMDVAADLEVIARLLYRLLVKQGADLERLEAGAGWSALTCGCKQLLAQALHRNPERRFRRAADLRLAIERLVTWWQQSADFLMKEAVRRLGAGPLRQAAASIQETTYYDALQMLDIAQHKGAPQDLLSLVREKACQGLRETGILHQAQAAYLAGRDEEAAAAVAEARDKAGLLAEQLAAARWEAVLAEQYQDRETVARWVGVLAAWTEAWLEEASTGGKPQAPTDDEPAAPPELLAKEWEAWKAVWQGQQADKQDEQGCRRAAASYRRAMALAHELPYGDLIAQVWGNLDGRVAELEASADQLSAQRRLDEELQKDLEDLQKGFEADPADTVEVLIERLKKMPGDEPITRLAIDWAEKLWWNDRHELALRCLGGIVLDAAPGLLREILSLRRKIGDGRPWHRRLKIAEQHLSSQQEKGDALEPKRWGEILGALQASAVESPEVSPVRAQAWKVAQQALLLVSRQPALQGPLLEAARSLAPDPEAFDGLQKQGAERKKWQEEVQRRARLRRRIEACRQRAERWAKSGLDERYEMAIHELDRACQFAKLIPDSVLESDLAAERDEYKLEQQMRQIADYAGEAQRLMDSGVLSDIGRALEALGEAIELARKLGRAQLVADFAQKQQRGADFRRKVEEQWRWAEAHKTSGHWSGALQRLQWLEKEGISGREMSGEVQQWIAEVKFEQAAEEFRTVCEEWRRARDRRQKEQTLHDIYAVLEKMRPLRPYVDEAARGRLRGFQDQYRQLRTKTYED